ncbi:MAG: prepilin-type N-terminal cleavage/methylation domain-containing protein [Planctomycetota bacterium]|jgi:prepilin-type N-terminal cleavage/methylation domain-containing protein/prepilin-type processing-associated H-X9-DG protein|nr:prepilin-type N-terminal cleavage/methylation domain-containing protein [Planctomycetota bacterium]
MRYAFTLIELLIVVSIIAVLAALLIPAVSLARASAQNVSCLAHVRQVGIAALGYTNDNDGWLCPLTWHYADGSSLFWGTALLPYVDGGAAYGAGGVFTDQRTTSVFKGCPVAGATRGSRTENTWNVGYGYTTTPGWRSGDESAHVNWWGYSPVAMHHLQTVEMPSSVALLGDARQYFLPHRNGLDESIALRHGGRSNLGFADGHVASCDRDAVIEAVYGDRNPRK